MSETFEALGRIIVTWSWQLAIFIAFLWLVVQFDRRHRPEFRHKLWTFALIVSFALPWITQEIALYSWTIRAKEVWIDPQAAAKAPTVAPGNALQIPNAIHARDAGVSTAEATVPLDSPRFSPNSLLYGTVGFLWLAGLMVGTARRFSEGHRIRAIVARAVIMPAKLLPERTEVSIPILLSSEISSPTLCGLFRPAILLPATIARWNTPEKRTAIIRHENVHFLRKHHWVSRFEGFLRTVLFFHPFFRWMCRQLDIERELVCDAEVLRRGANAETYAETLLLVAEHAIANDSGIYFATRAQLDRRVECLFRPGGSARLAAAAAPFILLTPLVFVGFLQAKAQAVAPLESRVETRFLPAVPQESLAGIPAKPAMPQPILHQDPVQPPAPPAPPPLHSAVMVLRGQGVANEVFITIGIPYAAIPFNQRTFPTGFAVMEGRTTVAMRLSRLPGQRVSETEELIEVSYPLSAAALPFSEERLAVFQKSFLLEPEAYSLVIDVKDPATGASSGVMERRLSVPQIPHNALGASSLVIADLIEDSSPRHWAFRVGKLRVRPNVTESFRRDQNLGLFQQVYSNSAGSVTFETLITANGQEFRRMAEEVPDAPIIAIRKTLPLADFPPGIYGIQTTVTEPGTAERVISRAEFTVQ